MKWLSRAVSIIAIFLLAFSSVSAQSASLNFKEPLTLKECVQITLENSSRIAVAKRSLTQAQLEVKDARAGYLPRLDLSADYQVDDTHNKIEWTEDHYEAKASLTETFYDNGKTQARTKQAKARLEADRVDFQKIRDELIFEVTGSYYALLKAEKMLRVKDEGLKQAQAHLDLAKARHRIGTAPKSDILKAEVGVGSSELDLIEAENTLSLARMTLSNVMEIDLNTPLLVSGAEEIEPIEMALDECLDLALRDRPEIREAEISLRIDEIDLKLARKEVWPSIEVAGSYNIDADQLINEYDWDESTGWEIGIKTSFPIFDAGQTRRGVTKARINLENTRTEADQLAKNITLEVKKAYLTLKSQQKVIETTEKQVAQAKESFDAAQGRYKSGVAPMIEVIDAQASLNNARTNYVKAIYDYQMAIFTLNKAMGGITMQ
ncbi:TolC family protein [bacterium]|nr:TolC family protein [bacterium]MBU1615074.1 TolC family protein [bacterium]